MRFLVPATLAFVSFAKIGAWAVEPVGDCKVCKAEVECPKGSVPYASSSACCAGTGDSCIPEGQCSKGCAVWNDGCNTCQCGEDGFMACTKKLCEKPGVAYCERYEEPKPEPDCENKKCASVQCSAGHIPYSTEPGCCPGLPSGGCCEDGCVAQGQCSEGCAVWNDGCNECECDESGKLTKCTEKACLVQQTPFCVRPKRMMHTMMPTMEKPELLDGEVKKTSLPTYTKELPTLTKDLPTDKFEVCPVGCKVWNDGCNECSCDAPGKTGACTTRYCIQQGTPSCTERVELPGKPQKPDCSTVFCAAIAECPAGQELITLPGECCPTCVDSLGLGNLHKPTLEANCAAVSCPARTECPSGQALVKVDGRCCPTCEKGAEEKDFTFPKPFSGLGDAADKGSLNFGALGSKDTLDLTSGLSGLGAKFRGKQTVEQQDCTVVRCAAPPECEPGYVAEVPAGGCCPVCVAEGKDTTSAFGSFTKLFGF